ncbi:EAL domain-containing protein [Thiomicrorhabdus sediminis]|nr:EAL domain-containing protein [Thiomicrorhabdus sediminis]
MDTKTISHASDSHLDIATLDFLRRILFSQDSIEKQYIAICQFVGDQLQLSQVSLISLEGSMLRLINGSDKTPRPIEASADYIDHWHKHQTLFSTDIQSETLFSNQYQHHLKAGNIACLNQYLIDNKTRKLILSLENQSKPIQFSSRQQQFIEDIRQLLADILKREQQSLDTEKYRNLYSEFESAFDGSNYSIISTDSQGIIRSFNHGASLMLGYSAEEAIGKTPELFHDTQEVIKRAAELTVELNELIEPGFETFVAKTRRGEIEEREWTYIHKDGHRLPVLLSVSAIRDQNNEISGFLGIAIDISDRVLTSRAIREQEATYRLLYEASSDGIFLVHDGIIIDINPAAQHLFACKREQIIGQPPTRFFPQIQPNGDNSAEVAQQKIYAALNGKNQFFEWQHITYNGTPFDSEVTLNTFMVDDKVLLLGIIRDISERKRTQQELDNSRLSLIEKNRNLMLINRLSSQLQHLTNKQHVYLEVMNTIIEHIPIAKVGIYEVEEQNLVLKASCGLPQKIEEHLKTLDINNSLTGQALHNKDILITENISQDSPIIGQFNKEVIDANFQSAVVIPLYFNEQLLGSLNIFFEKQKNSFYHERELYETIGKTLSISMFNTHNMQAMQYLARHDSLTNLGNRSLFHHYFDKHIMQPGRRHATVILFDLDRFKEINDTLGHHIGDLLLQQIGPRIESALEGYQYLLCRLGGDEFTLLIENLLDDSQRIALAEKLHSSLRQAFFIDKMHLEIDSSFGVSIYPNDGTDSHALLRSADVAMYHAKTNHLGVSFYEREFDTNSPERLMLLADLNNAIKENQLVLFYQPKLNLQTQTVEGFEALIRWQHPERGLLFPDSFMPLAEVSDVIYPFTDHVIELAMQQQKQWLSEGKRYSVSVNISARNLMDERLYPHLKACLKKYKTPAELFELELTETALMQDPERAITILKRIATLNVKLSVDDFGTGYSSLAYLRRLPLNALKIDRVFVKDMLENDQDEIIVHSTIALAHNLKLQVIAEGVENLEIIERLQGINCDMVQGYFLSQPKPWKEMRQWLKDNNY